MSSHLDSQDLDQVPDLSSYRNRALLSDSSSMANGYHSLAFQSQDRRTSHLTNGFSSFAVGGSRPFAMTERDYAFTSSDFLLGPNRHNPSISSTKVTLPTSPFSSFNHNHSLRPSPPPLSQNAHTNALYHTSSLADRDTHAVRHASSPTSSSTFSPPANGTSHAARSTLLWGDIEPWMDEEYAKQVCNLMGWDPVNIKVPQPAPDPVTGQQANNPGYCLLTFPSPAHAATVLAQINNGGNGPSITMPNSSKPFVLNWAPTTATTAHTAPSTLPTPTPNIPAALVQPQPQYQKEYSIFVGDLAPETSNSDLVAVFRNPVLGLRNDREPKFIRPFLSCKSAKIMLDPVTGVSRGYGFVRFTDESDQQRALIEMHGLYCLSRPMRISPATAKYKPPPVSALDLSQLQFPSPTGTSSLDQQSITIALPVPSSTQTKSVSAPIASTSNNSLGNTSVPSSSSSSSIGGSNSSNSVNSTNASTAPPSLLGSITSEDIVNVPNNVLAQIAQQYANGDSGPVRFGGGISIYDIPQDVQLRQQNLGEEVAPRYVISEESWKHHAQARAILGNLIGPNGEQLTSTDPYNTTVFVGGLSPLISEETLRTFFAPFGDIHYVKVPVGKHCGFVQFVRKADAERAIEKMQGFPIGGSRIRLSWGRSQYKAAQAAAQAAQASALQAHFASTPAGPLSTLTQDQAVQLLHKLAAQGYITPVAQGAQDNSPPSTTAPVANYTQAPFLDEKLRSSLLGSREEAAAYDYANNFGRQDANAFPHDLHRPQPVFSPFSPDPNNRPMEGDQRQLVSASKSDGLPHPSKAYAAGFFPQQAQDLKLNMSNASVNGGPQNRVSPTSTRPPSASRYGSFLESSNSSFQVNRAPGRPEAPISISRPPSGSTSRDGQDLDTMTDLNGTLASLELDKPWRSSDGVSISSSIHP